MPSFVVEQNDGSGGSAGGARGDGAGAAGSLQAGTGTGGASGAGQTGGGGGASASGQGGAGSGGGGRGPMLVDRCRDPGTAPADGNSDGSDYHFGSPRDIFRVYPTYDYVALGDVNRDGYLDLLASGTADLHLFIATGPAIFGPRVPLALGITANSYRPPPLLAHVDSDLGLDVVMGHSEGMSVVWNEGDGGFTRFERSLGPAASLPVVADIDADGDRDVVALWRSEVFNGDEVTFYLNDGNGVFEAELFPLMTEAYGLRVADVTGDGAQELLVSTADPSIRIYARARDETFTLMTEIPRAENLPGYQLWFDTGDLDGDGLSDLVTVEDEDFPDLEQVYVAYQRNGQLEPLRALVPIPKDGGNIAGGAVTIADMNRDGRNDIVFTSSAFDMVGVLARADGTFHEVHTAFPTFGSILDRALAVGDLDCDGCPDALGANVGQLVLFPGVACAH